MKVNSISTKNLSSKGFYNSKLLKRGLEFSANNGSLFAAGASLVLSSVVRPAIILATPKTDKENKQIACAKSISSSAVGYLMMLGASLPVSRAIKKIDKSPEKYLKEKTISTLKGDNKTLGKSKTYMFATQLFKLGLGFVIAAPKSVLTCALIPPILKGLGFNHDKEAKPITKPTSKNVSFKGGIEKISKGIGKTIDTSFVQNMSEKLQNSNFAMHFMALTDTLATATFIQQTKHNKKIKDDKKKMLIYNSVISTGLSLASSYAVDKALDKPTQKFIDKFSKANANSPKLDKYIEGIKIAKPILILGSIYYLAIPLVSTFLSDKLGRNNKK